MTRSRGVAALYFALALTGLVGTWVFNLRWASGGGGDYVAGWFANDASSSAAVDVLVVALAAVVVYVREYAGARRVLVPLVFVLLSAAVAVSFALPLFLGLRELGVLRRADQVGGAG